MHTTGNIIGRHVRLTSGETLGPITDLIVDHEAREVIALRVQVNGALHEMPYAAVIEAQDAALTITGRDDLAPASPRASGIGAHVSSSDGAPLGALSGVRVDPATGRIRSYEIRPTGARTGVLVPAPNVRQAESGTLVVTPGTAALLSSMHDGEQPRETKGELTSWA